MNNHKYAIKIPKYLQRPVEDWTERYGMKRACKVIDIQARMYKKDNIEAYYVLKEVSDALKASINKDNPLSESSYLKWNN